MSKSSTARNHVHCAARIANGCTRAITHKNIINKSEWIVLCGRCHCHSYSLEANRVWHVVFTSISFLSFQFILQSAPPSVYHSAFSLELARQGAWVWFTRIWFSRVCGPVWPYQFVIIIYSYRVTTDKWRLHDSTSTWILVTLFHISYISTRCVQKIAGWQLIILNTLFASSSVAEARPKWKQEFLFEHTFERIYHFIICPPSISCGCVCGAASAADTETQIASQQLRQWARPNREIHNCGISECAPRPLPYNNMLLLEFNFTYAERERNHVDAGFRLCALDHDTVTNIHIFYADSTHDHARFDCFQMGINNTYPVPTCTYVSLACRVGGLEMRIARKVNGQWCRC